MYGVVLKSNVDAMRFCVVMERLSAEVPGILVSVEVAGFVCPGLVRPFVVLRVARFNVVDAMVVVLGRSAHSSNSSEEQRCMK